MLLKIFLVSATVLGISQGGILKGGYEKEGGNVAVNPYLMGGEVVPDRFYPSMVSIQFNNHHVCGGVILNENWILTAAQCVDERSPSSITAFVGSNLLNSGDAHTISEIKVHEEYNAIDSWRNDIALLRVDIPIKFIWGTLPATLPPKGLAIYVNTLGLVVGWGSQEAGGDLSVDLRILVIHAGDTMRCNSTYHGYSLNVYRTQFCDSGVDGQGSCDGDMGGPLFIDHRVAGLVSWGKPCGHPGYPTVYTRVSEYIDWINGHINQ